MKKTITLRKELNKYFDTGVANDTERLSDIEQTKKIISAYDLAKYIEKEFSGIFTLKAELHKLLISMQEYCDKPTIKGMFIPSDGRIKICWDIQIGRFDSNLEIRLYEILHYDNNLPTIRIVKERKTNDIIAYTHKIDDYTKESREDLYCIKAHAKQIEEIFNKYKCYDEFIFNNPKYKVLATNKLERILNQLKFSSEIFDLTFLYNYKNNKLVPYLSIKEEHIDLVEEYNTTAKEINNLINQQDNILKKIPIRIPELSYEVQDIIHRQTIGERLETTKQKPLIRKRTKKVG